MGLKVFSEAAKSNFWIGSRMFCKFLKLSCQV